MDLDDDDGHKFHQHDADLTDRGDDDPQLLDPDDAWRGAWTPVEYVLSSDAAMASAIEQQADGE